MIRGAAPAILHQASLGQPSMKLQKYLIKPDELKALTNQMGGALSFTGKIKGIENKILGKGSFGTVYLGLDLANDRYVSLKKIPPEIKADAQKLEALSNEILISAGVDNENLVKILDLTDIGEDKYIVYEYCNGGDLRRYLRYFRRFDERAVQYLLTQVLTGLNELHSKKIIHHDIKPENILVELKPFELKDNKNIEEKKNSKKK